MMKRYVAIAMVLGAFSGCTMLQPVPKARKESYQRWYSTRAQMLCSVAERHLKVGQLDQACSKARQAITLDKEFLNARVVLARIYIEQGHYEAAIAELTRVRQNRPNSAEVFYLLGVAQEKAGRLETALGHYNRAYALDNSRLDAVKAAAETLVAMGNVRKAQLHIESYLHQAGEDPGMYELAGRLAMMSKQYDKAADYYRQASDLDYKNIAYQQSLAKSQFYAGRYKEAAEMLKDLTAKKSFKASAWVHAMQGDCYMAMAKFYEARDAYWKASDLSGSAPGIWTKLGKVSLALNDMPRAILSARHALQLDADNLEAVLVLGYALLRDGQMHRAISLLTQASAQHSDSSTLRCLLGRSYAASGDEAKANRCYAMALQLNPKDTLAKELLGEAGIKKVSKLD